MSERADVVQNFEAVEVSQLLTEVKNLKADGYRFAQACATVVDDKIEIIYSFDKAHQLKNLRITTVVTDSITSRQLTSFIEDKLGLKHLRFKRGYKNVINKSKELNEQGIDSQLAIETSGHAA